MCGLEALKKQFLHNFSENTMKDCKIYLTKTCLVYTSKCFIYEESLLSKSWFEKYSGPIKLR